MERAETPRHTVPRPRALLGALAALALALGAIAGPAAAAPKPQPPGASKAADPARTATVMTRNLYLGADLGPVVAALANPAPDGSNVVLAATATWQQVLDSHPEERMGAIADEIVAAKPHAVGLQEVTRWTTYDYNPAVPPEQAASNPSVAYDFLDLLLAELAERGVTYREVPGATATNFTSPPIPILPGNRAVSLQDRDVIIVRNGVKATNAQSGNFEAILGPDLGFPLPADRGWGSADLRTKLATFRFVNSHTEAFSPEFLRVLEVQELLAEQERITLESGPLPTVYAGDYNSPVTLPAPSGYTTLLAGGLHDLWTEANPGATAAQGATCCQDADLRNAASKLTTRIDLLLGSEGVRARSAERIGDEPVTLPDGVRWASDHAGVVADVVIPRP